MLGCLISLVNCSSINEQQNVQIETLTQRVTELENQYKQDQQAIANLKKKEADLNLLIDVLGQQQTLTGYKTVNNNAAQIIKIKPNKPLTTVNNTDKKTRTSSAPLHAVNAQTAPTNLKSPQVTESAQAYAVQIASLTSKQQSQQAWQNFQLKFPTLSKKVSPIIESTNKDNINFLRLKIGPYSKAKALETCTFLKQNQQNCLIKRYTGNQF